MIDKQFKSKFDEFKAMAEYIHSNPYNNKKSNKILQYATYLQFKLDYTLDHYLDEIIEESSEYFTDEITPHYFFLLGEDNEFNNRSVLMSLEKKLMLPKGTLPLKRFHTIIDHIKTLTDSEIEACYEEALKENKKDSIHGATPVEKLNITWSLFNQLAN